MVSNKKLFKYLLATFIILYALLQYFYNQETVIVLHTAHDREEESSDNGTYPGYSKDRNDLSAVYGRMSGRNKQIPVIVGKNETAYLFNEGVCIEKDRRTGKNIITVFNAETNTHRKLFGYWVKFLTWPFPEKRTHNYNNYNAYFLKAKGGLFRNMDHCFKDILITLFQLLKKLGHLKNTTNILFTTEDRKKWPDFNFGWLKVLNVNTKLFPQWNFNHVPPGTCFSRAVFANTTHESFSLNGTIRHRPQDVKDVTGYLLSAYNITQDECHRQKSQPKITIIERKGKRKILNIHEIMSHLHKAGYTDVTATAPERRSLRGQMLLAYCSDLLIGVHGAGLGWVFFMRPGSAMIEIAYPSQGWYFYYTTKGYAVANYPDVRVFQLELFTISEDINGSTVYHHDVWVPVDKLLQFVNDAVSGKQSYYPYKLAQTYKIHNGDNATYSYIHCLQDGTHDMLDSSKNDTDLRTKSRCLSLQTGKQWSPSEGVG